MYRQQAVQSEPSEFTHKPSILARLMDFISSFFVEEEQRIQNIYICGKVHIELPCPATGKHNCFSCEIRPQKYVDGLCEVCNKIANQ